jgi:hypothetical protein
VKGLYRCAGWLYAWLVACLLGLVGGVGSVLQARRQVCSEHLSVCAHASMHVFCPLMGIVIVHTACGLSRSHGGRSLQQQARMHGCGQYHPIKFGVTMRCAVLGRGWASQRMWQCLSAQAHAQSNVEANVVYQRLWVAACTCFVLFACVLSKRLLGLAG